MTRRMDAWGVSGCREHADEILDHLRANQDKYGWTAKLTAAAGVLRTGLWRKIQWTDPFPGLVEEAVRRAEIDDEQWNQPKSAAKTEKSRSL